MSPYERLLTAPEGYASPEVGLFVAQMDDQSRRLALDTRAMTPEELAWQPAPGMNTIGMLLAHIAIVEVFWLSAAAERPLDCVAVLGIGEDDDGLPIAEGAAPPGILAGRDLAFYDDLLDRARRFTKQLTPSWPAEQLDRTVQRKRADGNLWTHNVRWILYHVLEHEAGHYGQINLLHHHYRAERGEPVVARRPSA